MALTAAEKLLTPAALAKFFFVSVPLLGSEQGFRQMPRMTGPALPFLPKCTWMAWAPPVSFDAEILYLIDLPLEATVNVALPVPFDVVLGTSDLPSSVALNLFLPSANAVAETATVIASKTNRNLRMARPPGDEGCARPDASE